MKPRIILLSLFTSVNLACQSQNQLNLDACQLKKNVDNNLSVIQKNAKQILKSEDNCILALLDSLTTKFIQKDDRKYIETLDSICKVADGYVGEYYWEIGQRLFHNNFKGFFLYLYTHKHTCLEKEFVDAISVEINEATDRDKKKKEIEIYLKEQEQLLKMNESQKEYLKKLQSQINPNILD